MKRYTGIYLNEDDAIFTTEETTNKCYICEEEKEINEKCSWIYDAHDTDEEEFVCEECTEIYVDVHERPTCAICEEIIESGDYCDKHDSLIVDFFDEAIWVSGRNQEEERLDEGTAFADDLVKAFRRGQVIFSYKHNSPHSENYHLIAIGKEFETHYRLLNTFK